MQFLSLSEKSHYKNIQSENSNLAPFTLIKMMLNELFPAFDNSPLVCESMFTFVQEIKFVLHYCTLKRSFYNFIWNENMIPHRFSNQYTFRTHLLHPQSTHPFPVEKETFICLFINFLLFSLHAWKEKWTKVKNIIKWKKETSRIWKHMNDDNDERFAFWCRVHLFVSFSCYMFVFCVRPLQPSNASYLLLVWLGHFHKF